MGKAKRCRTVAISASVAAIGAATACPTTNAAQAHAPAPRAAVRHAQPRRRPTRHRGPYVYKAIIGGRVSTTSDDMLCAGSTIRFVGVNVDPEPGDPSEVLWARMPSAWRRPLTVVAGPATTISVPWSSAQETREAEEHEGNVPHPRDGWATAPASRVCAATTANAGLASVGEGVVTWRLPAPAASVAALLANAPTNVAINELATSFHIEPDGTVPPFASS